MTGDVAFLHYADRKAEEGDINEVGRANWLYPQIYLFVLTFPVGVTAIWLGFLAVLEQLAGDGSIEEAPCLDIAD